MPAAMLKCSRFDGRIDATSNSEFVWLKPVRQKIPSSEIDVKTNRDCIADVPPRRVVCRYAVQSRCIFGPNSRKIGLSGRTVGAVYDRAFFLESTKYARS